MALTTPITGGQINASDVAQLVAVLQRPASSTETGKYIVNGNSYVDQGIVSTYIASLSRGAAPVSVTVDTADLAPFGMSASAITNRLTAGGFQVYGRSTGAQITCGFGGNYTIQY